VSLLVNLTNFATAHVISLGTDGLWQVTALAKATYTWNQLGEVSVARPAPITMADEFAGDDIFAGLLRARDLAPPKPRLDVLLAGTIVFPRPITEIEIELAVGARLHKRARVFGDRIWLPGVAADRVPSRPKPVGRVPIAWERGFGGVDPHNPKWIEPDNPAGSGVAKNPKTLHGRPAPNFEDPEKPIGRFSRKPGPIGFGPIAAHWQPRLALAGAYDQAWQKSRKPLPPEDFSTDFFNVAPADQQLDGFLPGEEVRLHNLTATGDDRFCLPRFTVPMAIASSAELAEGMAAVDTLTIEPDERRFSLLAKAQASLADGPESLGRIVVGEMTQGMRSALETGKRYPWSRKPQEESHGQGLHQRP
jgi:hypothetical protein